MLWRTLPALCLCFPRLVGSKKTEKTSLTFLDSPSRDVILEAVIIFCARIQVSSWVLGPVGRSGMQMFMHSLLNARDGGANSAWGYWKPSVRGEIICLGPEG